MRITQYPCNAQSLVTLAFLRITVIEIHMLLWQRSTDYDDDDINPRIVLLQYSTNCYHSTVRVCGGGGGRVGITSAWLVFVIFKFVIFVLKPKSLSVDICPSIKISPDDFLWKCIILKVEVENIYFLIGSLYKENISFVPRNDSRKTSKQQRVYLRVHVQ